MREIAIITGRELKSYFVSPIAYVFGGLFLIVLCYLTVTSMLVEGQTANLQSFFQLLPIVFLFFLPALTMRLWAEERKLGTLELLMTFPVSVRQLITGKFLASLIYLSLVMLLTIGVPLTVAAHGDLDWGPVACAYIASLLMAGAYISVGMFCSAVTRDQIIALLLALVLLLVLFLLGSPFVQENLQTLLPEVMVSALAAASPYQYFNSIARGVLDTRDLIFYLCFCGFFLHLNALVLQGRRMKG
ncbi:MAG: ABC transporter permease [Planctomycetota bacterium]